MAKRTDTGGMTPRRQLDSFIARYSPAIAGLARKAFAAMRKRVPTATVMVYDNYNALAIGFCPGARASEAILSLVLYPRWVTLFLLQGATLDDPDGILRGEGKQVRHIVLEDLDVLFSPPVQKLITQALAEARVPLPDSGRGAIVIKSISAKQRPRRPR